MIDTEACPHGLMEEIGTLAREVRDVLDAGLPARQRAAGIHSAFAKRGYHALVVPRESGGRGLDHLTAGLIYEALSYELPGTLHGTMTTAHCALMISSGLTNEFHLKRLEAIAGEDHPGAFCLTERDAGSDIGAVGTRAETIPGGFTITGEKAIAINHAIAKTLVVFATLPPASGRAALNAFVVDPSAEGIRQGPALDTPGMAGGILGPISFDRARVPHECLLGERGSGYLLFMETLDKGRPLVAACCTGEADRALDCAIDHARKRYQFGKPLYAFQDVSFRIAELSTRLKAARLLWKDALERIDGGRPFTMEASMAKLFASSTLMDIASFALELTGYRSVGRNTELERIYHGARLMKSIDGTEAVQKMVIASQL